MSGWIPDHEAAPEAESAWTQAHLARLPSFSASAHWHWACMGPRDSDAEAYIMDVESGLNRALGWSPKVYGA